MLEAFTKFQTCVLCLVKVCLYISSFMSMIHKWKRREREREKCAFITKHYECMEEETWKKHTLRQYIYIYICPIDRVDNICVRGVRVGCGAMMHATTKQASNFCNKTNQPKIYLSIFYFFLSCSTRLLFHVYLLHFLRVFCVLVGCCSQPCHGHLCCSRKKKLY